MAEAEAAVQPLPSPGPPSSGVTGAATTTTTGGSPSAGNTLTNSPAQSPSLTDTTPVSTPHSNSSPFRPSPVRSLTVSNPYLASVKGRATSQPPASDRLPNSQPSSGRGSPGMNGANDFGVIGGSRTPSGTSRMSSSLVGVVPPTRANSFSVADMIDQRPSSLVRTLSSHVEERPVSRSTSPTPYPTFSPSSSPSTSPTMVSNNPLSGSGNSGGGQYSPPIAPANVSRSRSQSLAAGVRPDRSFMAPLSALESSSNFRFDDGWRKDSTNMSPFTSSVRSFLGNSNTNNSNDGSVASPASPSQRGHAAAQVASSFRTPQESTFGQRAWASPTTTALTTSVADALGPQPTYSSVVGGFEESNGGRSGTSSRRHSVSVVGGGPRRGFSFNEQGMSTIGGNRTRGIGSLGFTDDELLSDRFDNALNLQVGGGGGPQQPQQAKPKRSGSVIEGSAMSLPIFAPSLTDPPRAGRPSVPSADAFFGSSPAADKSDRGRFSFADTRSRQSFSATAGAGGTAGPGAPGVNAGAGVVSGSPDRGREGHPGPVGAPVRAPAQVAPIGFDGRFGAPMPPPNTFRGAGPFAAGPPLAPGPTFGRPPAGPFGYFGGGMPQAAPGRPPFTQNGGGFGGIGPGFGPTFPAPPIQQQQQPNVMGGGFGAANYYGAPPQPPAPVQQQPGGHNQSSPSSFSSLSLADLGKGIPLVSLPPTTPLYIVTFKAGRRDVFYCPDPTLLISNGDRVIVEADRGSDLGTVVYDQLTPVDVREWQERQATAALLSGASQHQPPGMAMAGAAATAAGGANASPTGANAAGTQHSRNGSQPARPLAPGATDFTGADLNTLLSGVGPSGSQMDMGGGGIGARGPLAKEIMPKRIFTKSSGGPEEQARMVEKLKEEYDAMMICREKVAQRGLPMQIVDAEYQWDRRKLTFYFKADKRVDFRELTKENFRIFKSRIWMSMVPKDDPRG